MVTRIELTDEQWREQLTPEQYRVLRGKGTERAFTGEYWNTDQPGVYRCAGCGTQLYTSEAKFDSGCGWPSFTRGADDELIDTETDRTLFMVRTEIMCAACGGHLGHVFDDGPSAGQHAEGTGMRHCVNSASIVFEPAES